MAVFRKGQKACTCGCRVRRNVSRAVKTVKATCPRCGAVLQLQVSTDWWVSWRDPAGKIRSDNVGPDRQAAMAIEGKIRTELAEDRYLDRKASCTTTLAEAVRGWCDETGGRRKLYQAQKLQKLLERIAADIGPETMLDKVTGAEVEKYRGRRLGKGIKPGSVATELAWLRAVLRWAHKRELVAKIPEIKIPNPHNERIAHLDKKQQRDLLACCAEISGLLADVVAAALFTGCRKGELLALRWEWIDLKAGRITFPGEVTKNGRPKPIPISGDMRALLKRRMAQASPGAPVFHREGKPLSWSALDRRWKDARARAGLKGFHFHDLRHVAATTMLENGTDLYTVSKILGHATLQMAARYSHVADDSLRRAVDCCNLGFEGPEPEGDAAGNSDCHAVDNVIPLPKKQGVRS